MDVLERIQKEAEWVAHKLVYETVYEGGVTEDLDQYRVTSPYLPLTCYGPSKAAALEAAQKEAAAQLMENSSLRQSLLAEIKTWTV